MPHYLEEEHDKHHLAIPVHVERVDQKIDVCVRDGSLYTRAMSAEYGGWTTYFIPMGSTVPIKLLPRDPYRSRALIRVRNNVATPTTNSTVLVGTQSGLSAQAPQGGTLFHADAVEVFNQQELWGIGNATADMTITVLVERWADDHEHVTGY